LGEDKLMRSCLATGVATGVAPRTERGLTFLSLLVLLAGIVLIGLAGFRLIPIYLNQMKVVAAMESVRDEYRGQETTPAELRSSLYKRFDIEMVGVLKARDVSIKRNSGEYTMRAQYQNEVRYLGNVWLLVKFDHVVDVPRGR
jgi:hypothetical protein